MNPLKSLEPDQRDRYDYVCLVLEEDFEETYLQFLIHGILVYEVLNLLPLCAEYFDGFGFSNNDDSRFLRYAVTGRIAQYLEGGDHNGL